ncbi:2-polyprenylphenol 6-hydroxylase [Aestuariispira insulae]|uniref:2-octaprenylphenol hydroxylase n=1 Tax=Aestuariispira insulae TaxID=1461337 RepID=A0A3D9H9Q7_9PROT|nr:2-polyprenylphenol 6-hydroxylase [Aestuariispira insulae]RED46223.1 2-octaprenylphenol hydroxylase [Aestuariispira insulae]
MLNGLKNTIRLLAIVRTLARQDALWPLEQAGASKLALMPVKILWRRKRQGRSGEKLANALTDLGPTFIKLGQALSVRSDLVGERVAEDLARLQDSLPPFAYETAKATVERELGEPLDALFAEFAKEPVAAASIAQVHKAQTTDGRQVAVKILRPDVEKRFDQDVALFFWLAGLGERFFPKLKRLRLSEVVQTFHEWVLVEMDLRLEAAAASELAENCAEDEGFRVPEVDWDRTAKRVLCTEWVTGLRIDDLEGLRAAGHDVEKVLEHSARIFFLQVFRDGFFHADIHPGNMFVDENGILTPVDFGIMGRVDWPTRLFLADMLIGFLQRDYRKVSDVHFDMGVVPPHKSRDAFTQALRAIGEPLLGKPLNEISLGRLLAHLFQTTEDFDMETQPDLLLLQKTMVVAEGVGRKLNPKVNMWMLAQPLIEDWMIANRGPEAQLRQAAIDGKNLIMRLPGMLEKADRALALMERIEAGGGNDHRGIWGKRPNSAGNGVKLVTGFSLVTAIAALSLVLFQ